MHLLQFIFKSLMIPLTRNLSLLTMFLAHRIVSRYLNPTKIRIAWEYEVDR